jgi:NAD(P)-dependent dehydrogenase (short-subunit alcohol dehydrogenase family)
MRLCSANHRLGKISRRGIGRVAGDAPGKPLWRDRINAICPAIIETDLTKQIRDGEQSRALLMSRHPVGRFGRSEEVAAAVLYLCSPEASFITGVALPLDGGFAL